jgi:signal transduction histidine kinase
VSVADGGVGASVAESEAVEHESAGLADTQDEFAVLGGALSGGRG